MYSICDHDTGNIIILIHSVSVPYQFKWLSFTVTFSHSSDILPSTARPHVSDILPSTARPHVSDILSSTSTARPHVSDILPSTARPHVSDILPSTARPHVSDILLSTYTARPHVSDILPSTARPHVNRCCVSWTWIRANVSRNGRVRSLLWWGHYI